MWEGFDIPTGGGHGIESPSESSLCRQDVRATAFSED